jgi:hypothetical protein
MKCHEDELKQQAENSQLTNGSVMFAHVLQHCPIDNGSGCQI